MSFGFLRLLSRDGRKYIVLALRDMALAMITERQHLMLVCGRGNGPPEGRRPPQISRCLAFAFVDKLLVVLK